MQITDVRTTLLRYVCDKPIASAGGVIRSRAALIVEVVTDAGILGIGEAGAGCRALIDDELKPFLVGQDPLRIEWLWQAAFHRFGRAGRHGLVLNALGGIDVALWDILGKLSGRPIFELLGAYQERLPAYASGGFYQEGKGVAELQAEASAARRDGYRAFKMKVGRVPRLVPGAPAHLSGAAELLVGEDEDIARVAAVREALGPDAALMVDANCAWTPEQAHRFAVAIERYGIYWIEEPVETADHTSSAALAAATAIPISGYETEVGLDGFRRLIEAHAIDIVQPDLAWSGGISECRRIAALAQAHHLPYAPHCFSSALLLIASVHLVAALPNASLIEIDRNPHPLREELLQEPLIIRDGYVEAPKGPGLGVELRTATVERYRAD
jgi:L-alanine-DL-glutamate epimerase-like enolase superfamily enzyme